MEITQGSDCTIYFENTQPVSKATFQYYQQDWRTPDQVWFRPKGDDWDVPDLIWARQGEGGVAGPLKFDLAYDKVALVHLQGRVYASMTGRFNRGGNKWNEDPLMDENWLKFFEKTYGLDYSGQSVFYPVIGTTQHWSQWAVYLSYRIVDGAEEKYTWTAGTQLNVNMFMGEDAEMFSLSAFIFFPAGSHEILFHSKLGARSNEKPLLDYIDVKFEEAHIDLGFVDSTFIPQPKP